MAGSSTTSVTTTGKVVDVILPLFLLALLIALCVQLLLPFVGLLVWTIILAICFKPLHDRLMTRRGMSARRSAVIIGVWSFRAHPGADGDCRVQRRQLHS